MKTTTKIKIKEERTKKKEQRTKNKEQINWNQQSETYLKTLISSKNYKYHEYIKINFVIMDKLLWNSNRIKLY